MKRYALGALAAGTMLAAPAHAETIGNVWVNGTEPGYATYIVSVGADNQAGRVKLDLYVSQGQVITGVRNGTALCQLGHFGATCDLGYGPFPQHFEVKVKRQESAGGPFHLRAAATTSAPERNYSDNTIVIDTY
ncbi:hypothetical protein MTP10_17550 [Nonomuraea sp. 3-1Str]|uniref:hypothetical protein n=1 Tax=Nonomuraea sp. 3-1Str TaxID=2929801 RepID=UPI00285D400B|nr:hypothetical protein [Nonomuraea sp. 3-1Str]MDR8410534.1 hypothetical protein [Nonomuraea sp. 3-1Str]